MKPECKHTRPLLEPYLDDELPGSKRQKIEAHLEGCEDCRHHLATLSQRAEMLRAYFDEAAQAADFSGFEDRVLRRLADEKPLPWTDRFHLWTRETLAYYRVVWITALATAAILLAVLLPLRGDLRPQPAADSRPETGPSAAGDQPARVAQATPKVDNDVIIDSMEYRGERSMIYTVSRNNTTVIWLVDFDRSGAKDGPGEEL